MEIINNTHFARTRSELLYAIWELLPDMHINIFKEGPYYAIRVNSKVYATGVRNLYTVSVDSWVNAIKQEMFPIRSI